MAVSQKPSVLILGGLNTWSRNFASYLLPDSGVPRCSYLRIADKFSVNPPTTYLGEEFTKLLNQPLLEYQQANLTIAATVQRVFDPPEGQPPFDFVFDLTGEIRHDRPDMIQITQTVEVVRLLGQEAAKRDVKAYVRVTHPYYDTPEKGTHDEKENIKTSGIRGVWWHEAMRVLADIENLNLVLLRPALVYGPYVDAGVLPSTLAVASVYGYLKKEMKALWSPGKNPMNTVHVEDVAAAAFALAEWMSNVGRAQANTIAGEEIQPNDKAKVKEGKDLPDSSKKLVAPLFNLADDSNSTLVSIGNEMCSLFGTTFGFHDFFLTTMARITRLSTSVIEDINEEHVGGWTRMLESSSPPVTKTAVTAYMDDSVLQKLSVAFDASKLKNVIGYTLLHPQFSQEELGDVVERWKREGSWPVIQPQPA